MGVDAAARIVDEAMQGGGGGGDRGHGEGSGPERSASGASGDKAWTEPEEVVARGEDIEMQRDGEDDDAFMVSGTQHASSFFSLL